MNKTTVWAGVIIALLVTSGIIFYAYPQTTPTDVATSTPVAPPPASQVRTPGMPVVITAGGSFPSDTTVVVTGIVTPNGALTSYWYEYGTSADLGNKHSSPSQAIGSGFASIPAPSYIVALTKNTTYYFRLVAENSFGRIVGSQYSFKTTEGSPAPVGSAPTTKTLAVSDFSRTTANFVGEVTPNKALTGYWFEYGPTPNLGNTTAFQSVGDGTAKVVASISLSDLSPATTYYFRLNAQNQFGTVNGAILNFKTLGPASAIAPSVTTREVSKLGTSTVMLRAVINPGGTETAYWFEYSTDSLLGSVLLHSTEKGSAGPDRDGVSVESGLSGLVPKTNYYFRAVAENSVGTVRGERMTFRTK